MCKGKLSDGYSTFAADIGNCIIVVKQVPSRVCGQCGEVSYSDEVARILERIVNSVKTSTAAEIAVVQYSAGKAA